MMMMMMMMNPIIGIVHRNGERTGNIELHLLFYLQQPTILHYLFYILKTGSNIVKVIWSVRVAKGDENMKMGNIALRVGIEPTSLAFPSSVPTIYSPRLPYGITLHVSTSLCGSLPKRSVQIIRTILSQEVNVF